MPNLHKHNRCVIMMKTMQKQKTKPKSHMFYRMLFNSVFFVALIFGTFFFVFKDQNVDEIISLALSTNTGFVALGLLCMMAYFFFESWNVRTLLKNLGEKVGFFKSLKFTMIGFFFCSITPGASGGQPLEVYYMNKDGVSTMNATITILIQVFGVQVAVVGFGVLSGILCHDILVGPILWLYIIGLIINAFALLMLFFFIISPNFFGGLLIRLTRFLRLFMPEKRVAKLEAKATRSIKKYSSSSEYIKSHRNVFFWAVSKSVAQMACYFMVPFFIYLAFGLSGTNILTIFMVQAILFVSTSGLPLPGAIGASESVFLGLYAKIFGDNLLSSAMLINRGVSFYGFVLISMLFVFVNLFLISRSKPKN